MLTLIEKEGPLGPRKKITKVPIREGAVVWDYIPERFRRMDVVSVFWNYLPLNDDALHTRVPKSGDRLSLSPYAGGILFSLILFVVSIAAQWGLGYYENYLAKQADKRGKLGPTYGIDVMGNTWADGQPIPVIYGTHRVGGQIIQEYTNQVCQGQDEIYALFGLSEGPVNAVLPNGLSDLHFDGNAASNYPGVRIRTRTGTNTDTAIPDLQGGDGSTTTVSINTQLTYNAPVVTNGTAAADNFRIKINFPSGLYFSDSNAHRHAANWFCTVRYRTTAGPGAWSYVDLPSRNLGTYLAGSTGARVNGDSAAGSTRLYVNYPTLAGFKVGGEILINFKGPRQEKKTISAIGSNYLDLTAGLTYTHTKLNSDAVEESSHYAYVVLCRVEPFSVYIEGAFPSSDTYDVEVTRMSSDHDSSRGRISDAYMREYNQIANDSLIYPNLAKVAVQALASGQISDKLPRVTALVQGRKIMPLASATTFSAPVLSNNPADVFIDLLYNTRYGVANRIDTRLLLTLNTISAPFTVGEEILGPANDYQFKGIVREYSSPNIVIESTQGVPYTSLTGQTSGSTANITSVDEAYAFDLAHMWSFSQFCDEQVPNGTTVTTVDANSNSGQKVLNVASTAVFLDSDTATTVDADSAAGQKVLSVTSTAGYASGDSVLINSGGAREECKIIDTIQEDTSLTFTVNLANAHTAVQADDVTKFYTPVVVNYGGDREESGTIDTIQGGVSITLAANLTYSHTAAQADEVSVAENRAEYDYVYGGTENGYDALERIALCSRAMMYPYGGKFYVRPLKDETPGQIVTEGSIVRGSFTVSYLPTGDRPNMLDVVYYDAEDNFKQRSASIEDPAAYTNSEPIVRKQIELIGISRESQASRESYFRLKRLRYTGKVIAFKMGIKNIDFEVGDVFRFQHELPGIGTGGGLVLSSTNSTVTLDHDVTISGGETIRVRHSDDTQETATITSGAGTYRTLSISPATWTANPARDDEYGVGTLGRYRAISIKPDQKNVAAVTAEEDDSAYYVDDYGVTPTFTATTLPDPNELPASVTNVTLQQGVAVMSDASIATYIDVGFLKPDSDTYSHSEIYYRDLCAQYLVQGASDWTASSSNGEFNRPRGVCSDGTYLYVADTLNHRIVKLDLHDLDFSANIGSYGVGNAQFKYPHDVCTDGTHIWVADTGNHRVQKLTVGGVFAAKLGTQGNGNDQFEKPMGICHDAGNSMVFVADTYNHRLIKIDDPLVGAGGGTWTTLGAQGAGNDQFERPMGIDHYSTGSMLVVADTGNSRIIKVDDGLVGAGGGTFSTFGSAGTGDGNFQNPEDIATDGTTVWVTDTQNHRLKYHLYSDLSFSDELGSEGDLRDEFDYPCGIAHYGEFVYIAERSNHRVQARDDAEESLAEWIYKGDTATSSFRISGDLATGESYAVSVVAVSPFGAKLAPSDGATANISLTQRSATPPDVTGFAATNQTARGQLRLTWVAVNCSDLQHYEIRAGSSWQLGDVIGTTTATSMLLSSIAAGYSRVYYVKARTTSGVYSANADTVTYTPSNSTRAYGGNSASWNLKA